MKKNERERYERWEKSIEDTVGLPIDLIRAVYPIHKSFYYQNKDKMTIKQSGDEIFFFVSNNKLKNDIYKKVYGTKLVKSNREFVFDENSLDKYLKVIDFSPKIDSEFRIDQIPSSRFMTSKEINKEIDKIFG